MATDTAKNLLSAIAAFRDTHQGDPKFEAALSALNGAEESVEKISGEDSTPDPADMSPGKRAAHEAAQEGARNLKDAPPPPKPQDRVPVSEQPKNLRDAGDKASEMLAKPA